jgi:4-phospho-D-threonate 3-dehydrogenase / 4-phospho-D-erythronate 3-dehydrogenase
LVQRTIGKRVQLQIDLTEAGCRIPTGSQLSSLANYAAMKPLPKNRKPTIALTMGDPAGVGPELCLRALSDASIRAACNLVVFADGSILRRCIDHLNHVALRDDFTHLIHYIEQHSISLHDWQASSSKVSAHTIVDFKLKELQSLVPSQTSAVTGEASFQFIQRAIDAAIANKVAAVVTGPINKEALHAAGHFYPGHTEMFAERCAGDNPSRWCMMQYSDTITCSFVTVHCGYAEAPRLLSEQRVFDVIELTIEALKRIRGRDPRIVVCGLNPHAGEHGLFGHREEERFIIPAIHRAREAGATIIGPLPPDTAFIPAIRSQTDAFVCMYHDQGHIPVKALAFESAVNTTLGIKVIRTSVDHGTACDIAWQGIAKPDSLFAAIKLAIGLSHKPTSIEHCHDTNIV